MTTKNKNTLPGFEKKREKLTDLEKLENRLKADDSPSALARILLDSISLGASPMIEARAKANLEKYFYNNPEEFEKIYKDEKKLARDKTEIAKAKNPYTKIGSDVLASYLNPLKTASIVGAAAQGLIRGGVESFNRQDGNLDTSKLLLNSALDGGVSGLASLGAWGIGKGAQGLNNLSNKIPAVKEAKAKVSDYLNKKSLKPEPTEKTLSLKEIGKLKKPKFNKEGELEGEWLDENTRKTIFKSTGISPIAPQVKPTSENISAINQAAAGNSKSYKAAKAKQQAQVNKYIENNFYKELGLGAPISSKGEALSDALEKLSKQIYKEHKNYNKLYNKARGNVKEVPVDKVAGIFNNIETKLLDPKTGVGAESSHGGKLVKNFITDIKNKETNLKKFLKNPNDKNLTPYTTNQVESWNKSLNNMIGDKNVSAGDRQILYRLKDEFNKEVTDVYSSLVPKTDRVLFKKANKAYADVQKKYRPQYNENKDISGKEPLSNFFEDVKNYKGKIPEAKEKYFNDFINEDVSGLKAKALLNTFKKKEDKELVKNALAKEEVRNIIHKITDNDNNIILSPEKIRKILKENRGNNSTRFDFLFDNDKKDALEGLTNTLEVLRIPNTNTSNTANVLKNIPSTAMKVVNKIYKSDLFDVPDRAFKNVQEPFEMEYKKLFNAQKNLTNPLSRLGLNLTGLSDSNIEKFDNFNDKELEKKRKELMKERQRLLND